MSFRSRPQGQLGGANRWHKLKLSMCEALSTKKGEKTLQILQQTYRDADIVFLQEVAAEWLRMFSDSKMSKDFQVLAPGQMDSKRNQNSVIMVARPSAQSVMF